MGEVICLQRVRALREVRALWAEADACLQRGDSGGAKACYEAARVVEQFDLGVDTGMDDEMIRSVLGT